eukprot:scaffold19350_cov116-Isochrysis_galbana.AAC.2
MGGTAQPLSIINNSQFITAARVAAAPPSAKMPGARPCARYSSLISLRQPICGKRYVQFRPPSARRKPPDSVSKRNTPETQTQSGPGVEPPKGEGGKGAAVLGELGHE